MYNGEELNKQDFLDYIIEFMISTNWEQDKTPDVVRSLYTSWCFLFGIDADTVECDDALKAIYWQSAMEEIMEYQEFVTFMIELIV